MKTHLILILLLLAGGAVLGYKFYQQQVTNDENQYSNIARHIDKSADIDANIDTLVLKVRYGVIATYSEITALREEAKQILDDIKAAELITSQINTRTASDHPENGNTQDINNSVDTTLQTYESILSKKYQSLDDFRNKNSTLKQLLNQANSSGNRLINKLAEQGTQPKALLTVEKINSGLFQWALYSENEQALDINNNLVILSQLKQQLQNPELIRVLQQYSDQVLAAINQQKKTDVGINQALSVPTKETLIKLAADFNALEDLANKDIAKSRLYTLGYAIASLLIALYLILMMMRSYSKLEDKVKKRTDEISLAYNRLKESQEHMIQSEKMASLGQMVAGIAHEINTPLGYVSNNVTIVKNNIDYIKEMNDLLGRIHIESKKKPHDLKKISLLLNKTLKVYRQLTQDEVISESAELLDDSHHGLDEISELVKSLKDFSRIDRQAQEYYNIHQGINSTLKIASNTLRKHDILVTTDYHDLPDIQCIPSKLNQVFLNIITNAAQAMPKVGGKLVISTQATEDGVIVAFEDSGKGMPEEVKNKIFEPFYTTKPIGEGSGLGMSISYKIIESHHGTISIDSREGEGTTISIFLPKTQPDEGNR